MTACPNDPFARRRPGDGAALVELAQRGHVVLNATTVRPATWPGVGEPLTRAVKAYKGPRRKPGWRDAKPRADEVARHVGAGGLVGVVPSTLGLACWDLDGYKAARTEAEARAVARRGYEGLVADLGAKPFVTGPTRLPGGAHCWVRTDGAEPNAKRGNVDFRGGGGFVWLWPGEPERLLAALDAGRIPAVTGGAIRKANGVDRPGPRSDTSSRTRQRPGQRGERPSVEQVREALSFVRRGAVDFLVVAAALKSWDAGPVGEGLLLEWTASRGGDFDHAEDSVRWASLEPVRGGRSAGIGTLFHHAKLGGWRPAKPVRKAEARREAEEALRRRAAGTAKPRAYAFMQPLPMREPEPGPVARPKPEPEPPGAPVAKSAATPEPGPEPPDADAAGVSRPSQFFTALPLPYYILSTN